VVKLINFLYVKHRKTGSLGNHRLTCTATHEKNTVATRVNHQLALCKS